MLNIISLGKVPSKVAISWNLKGPLSMELVTFCLKCILKTKSRMWKRGNVEKDFLLDFLIDICLVKMLGEGKTTLKSHLIILFEPSGTLLKIKSFSNHQIKDKIVNLF